MKLLKLVPDDTNIRFLRWRVPFYAISLLLMAASLTLVFTKGLNLGVDFIGGQMIRTTFTQSAEAPVAELREQVGALGYGEPIIQRFGKPNEISIRLKLPPGSEADPALRQRVTDRLRTPSPARNVVADVHDAGRPRLEREHRVKRRDAVRLSRRHLQLGADVIERALADKPRARLGGMQRRQQKIPAPPSFANCQIDCVAFGLRRDGAGYEM